MVESKHSGARLHESALAYPSLGCVMLDLTFFRVIVKTKRLAVCKAQAAGPSDFYVKYSS